MINYKVGDIFKYTSSGNMYMITEILPGGDITTSPINFEPNCGFAVPGARWSYFSERLQNGSIKIQRSAIRARDLL